MDGTIRIQSLDGLRALSIALVLLWHLAGNQGIPFTRADLALDFGALGVRCFFVISGYLITTLLVREHARTGRISLRDFFLRRTFRIFPAFYVYVLVVAVGAWLGALVLARHDVTFALTYTMNYHHPRGWPLGHIWSLSVEEQFYLLWPALMALAGPRWIRVIALAMIVLAPAFRVAAWFWAPYRDDVIVEAYPCVMDAIAAGSALALFRAELAASPRYQWFLRSPLFVIVPAVMFYCNLPNRVAFEYTVAITLQNLGFALIIDRYASASGGPIFAALNWRPLAWIGTLSYSLYLWQQPFLDRESTRWFTAFPVNLVLVFACALASYRLVEKPFFALRDRLLRRRPP
jgi:peptidoglycan/LPS O-acetylase OafA/YrhL